MSLPASLESRLGASRKTCEVLAASDGSDHEGGSRRAVNVALRACSGPLMWTPSKLLGFVFPARWRRGVDL